MADVTGSGNSLAAAFRQAIAQASLGGARPSYRLRSPAAQFRQLSRTRLGRQALEQAGVRPAAVTRARWLSHVQRPSRSNTDAIRHAYGAMQQGGIPDWVKRRPAEISGSVRTGSDERDRGSDEHAPLRVNLGAGNESRIKEGDPDRTHWDAIEEALARDADDDELDELLGDLIAEDIPPSDFWEFPGDSYTFVISG
jgi:hypothetical protein